MGGRGGSGRGGRQPGGHGSNGASPAPANQTDEQQIFTAYNRLAREPGDLVSLVKLRGSLPNMERADLDRLLKSLDRQRAIQLEPDPNRKAIPPQAQDAAIRIGGQDTHFIAIDRRR